MYIVQVERVKSEFTKRITELEITLQRERAARGATAATSDKALEEARAKVLELTSQVRYCCPAPSLVASASADSSISTGRFAH